MEAFQQGTALPPWHASLCQELDSMAEELTATLQGWSKSTQVFTPEEMGYPGSGMATAYIQAAIDEAGKQGGGIVRLRDGTYVSGALVLASGVRLEVAKGARLEGSTDLRDYPEHRANRLTVQDTSMGMHQSLIFAQGCEDISLYGPGEIDGRGTQDHFPGEETAQGTPGRPFLIRMIDCKRVHIAQITLRDAACWMENYLHCEDLLVEGVTVRNQANYNNDGIDIDGCRRVIVRDCDIISGDDALCFKGASQRPLEEVLVERCRLYSSCNAVKVGTDTQGDFRKILVRNCQIGGVAEDARGIKHPYADSGISLEMMDGGTLEEIVLRDLTITRAWSPFFMRLEDRGRVKPGDPKPPMGQMRRVVIQNIRGTDNGPRGSYCTGIPERKIEDVVFNEICLEQHPTKKRVTRPEEFGEMRGVYPDAHMIDDKGDAPAYALWARHMEGLTLRNYRVLPTGKEARPEWAIEKDVTRFRNILNGE